jgi:hypothetical protein
MPRAPSPQAILDEWHRRYPIEIDIPHTFTAFVEWLGVVLTLGQRVIALICYDGLDPCDLEGEEREMARRIFGDVDRIPELARKVVVLVCGRRGGKSYVLEALYLIFAMYTVPFFRVAPGQIPIALVIAPNDELRQEVVNYAIGAIRSHPQLSTTLILHKGADETTVVSTFMIRRPCEPDAGRLVGFRSGVATHGGYGGRGKSLVGFALDEAAFFKSDTYKVNDVEIFKGALPGLMPGAKAIVPSTPWAQSGLVFEKWQTNWSKPRDAIVAHAPTTLLRPEMAATVEEERIKDPDYVEREFDAQFMAFGTTQFFAAALIESMLRRDVPFPLAATPGCSVAASVDLGFRSDSSAFSGTLRLPADDEIRLARLVERRPKPGEPLKPGETIAEFAGLARGLGCTYVMADSHYLESLREHAHELAVASAPASPAEVYVTARTLMRDGRCPLPHPDTLVGEDREVIRRLVQQLKEVQGRPIPGGGMSIILPRWRTGGHGDLVSTYVLSVYQMGGQAIPRLPTADGSAAWEQEQLAARKRKAREKSKQNRAAGAI